MTTGHSFVRTAYVSTLCPVVICPYLCTSDSTIMQQDQVNRRCACITISEEVIRRWQRDAYELNHLAETYFNQASQFQAPNYYSESAPHCFRVNPKKQRRGFSEGWPQLNVCLLYHMLSACIGLYAEYATTCVQTRVHVALYYIVTKVVSHFAGTL